MKAKAKTWVDFKAVKEKVGMMDILKHYGILNDLQPKKNGELTGYCPIHDENRYNKNSFCCNIKKNNWRCFACGAGGNILDFVAQMEEVDIRQGAILIQSWFSLDSKRGELAGKKVETKSGIVKAEKGQANPPLTFELKNLDSNHPYLKERGLEKETIKEFGLGLCQKGLMKGRIAIPIHNENGELVAYGGRYPEEPPEGEPKYKLPPKFQKHFVLYNFQKAKELAGKQGLIVVEGFFDLFKVWQAGFGNVVALMGTSLSDEQAELLIDALAPDGKFTLMLDPDEAGIKATEVITEKLIRKLFIKIIDLRGEGVEADSLAREKIRELLGN